MTWRTSAALFGVMAGVGAISSAFNDPAVSDTLYNRTNDPPSIYTVARVNNAKVLFKVVFYPYSKQFKVLQFTLPQVTPKNAGIERSTPIGDFDDNDFPPDLPPFDPIDDLPLPDVPDWPLPDIDEDPWDTLPEPPPFPDDPFPFDDLSDNTLSIMDSGGEQLGYSLPPQTSAKPGPRAATAAITKIRLGARPAGMVYSPDRTTLYVANNGSGTVSVVDMKARTVKSTINLPPGAQPYSIAITPDGKRLFIGETGIAALISVDLPGGTATRLPVAGTYVSKLAISPDGTRLWICHNLGRVTVLDLLTLATLAQPAVLSPWSIAFNRTGTRAYISSAPLERNGTVEVYDANTYTQIASIPVGFLPHGVGVTPSGRHVFVVNSWSPGSIMQISTATNTVVRTMPVGDFPGGLGMVH